MRTLASLLLAVTACTRVSAPTSAPGTSPAAATAQQTQTEGRVPTTSPSAEAPTLFLEAERLYYEFGMQAATDKVEATLAADPSYWRARLRRMHLQGEDRDTTIAQLRAGAAKLPALERRWLEARIAVFGMGEDPSYKELFAVADEAPADWEVQMAAAELAEFHFSKHAEARTYLMRAIAAQPTWAAPYNVLAYSYASEDEFGRAIEAITRYSELSPQNPNALDTKGEILLQAGQLDEAEASFRAALALDPAFVSFDGVAAVQLHRGEVAPALAGFERGWRSLPAQVHQRWTLGIPLHWMYLISERYDEATALVPALEQAAVETGHQYVPVLGLLLRARVENHRQRWPEALGYLDRAHAALESSRDTAAAGIRRVVDTQRVRALLGLKELGRAEKVLAELQAAGDDDPTTRLAVLLVAHFKGDLAAAKAAGKSLFRDRDYGAEAKLLIAELLVSAGHADKARTLRQEVARTYGRNPRSYLLRMRAERALKGG